MQSNFVQYTLENCRIKKKLNFDVKRTWWQRYYIQITWYLCTWENAAGCQEKVRDLENSDHLQFGPVVSLENSDHLLENSDHSWRIRPIRLENSDYYQIYVSNNIIIIN